MDVAGSEIGLFFIFVQHYVLTKEDSRLIQKFVAGGAVQFWWQHFCINCALCVVGMIIQMSLYGDGDASCNI